MSFILDALRKSEHERQRSAVPSLSQVPLATPRRELPPWALAVMGVLVVAVLVLAGAWWQSQRASSVGAAAPTPSVMTERSVALPPPPAAAAAEPSPAPVTTASAPAPIEAPPARSLSAAATNEGLAAATSRVTSPPLTAAPTPITTAADTATTSPPAPTLPSAAALRAEGISLPELHLELHAFSERPSERFVFINGRKYVEGERLADGPELVSIAPNGAVLNQLGRRFLLTPE